jgi:hypothetical protein
VKQHRLLAYLEELFDRFWGTGENNLVTFLDEWALDKIRLLGEDIQQLVIGELRLCEIEPFIDVFFFADDVRGFESRFFQKPFKFGFGKRLFIVIDSSEGLPAFLNQFDDRSARGTGGFMINRDFSHDGPSLL